MKKVLIPILIASAIICTCLGIHIGYGMGYWYETNNSYIHEGAKLVGLSNREKLSNYSPVAEVQIALLGFVIITEQSKTFFGHLYLSDFVDNYTEKYAERLISFVKDHPNEAWHSEYLPPVLAGCNYLICLFVTETDYEFYYAKYNELVTDAVGF